MPYYESVCNECGKEHEYVAKIADRKKTPKCCGKRTKSEIRTPTQVGAMVWTSHKSCVVNGKWMESGDQYKRYMKENNMVSESESKSMAAAAKQRQKEAEKKSLRKTVERVVSTALK